MYCCLKIAKIKLSVILEELIRRAGGGVLLLIIALINLIKKEIENKNTNN